MAPIRALGEKAPLHSTGLGIRPYWAACLGEVPDDQREGTALALTPQSVGSNWGWEGQRSQELLITPVYQDRYTPRDLGPTPSPTSTHTLTHIHILSDTHSYILIYSYILTPPHADLSDTHIAQSNIYTITRTTHPLRHTSTLTNTFTHINTNIHKLISSHDVVYENISI